MLELKTLFAKAFGNSSVCSEIVSVKSSSTLSLERFAELAEEHYRSQRS